MFTKRSLLLTVFVLLLSAGWMMAQTSTPDQSSGAQSESQSQMGQTGTQTGQMTVRGCLSETSTGSGIYVLTDSSGNTYQLQGDATQLSSHVGQEIEVQGTAVSSGNPSAMGTPSGTTGTESQNAKNALTVQSVKKISDTCSNPSPKS